MVRNVQTRRDDCEECEEGDLVAPVPPENHVHSRMTTAFDFACSEHETRNHLCIKCLWISCGTHGLLDCSQIAMSHAGTSARSGRRGIWSRPPPPRSSSGCQAKDHKGEASRRRPLPSPLLLLLQNSGSRDVDAPEPLKGAIKLFGKSQFPRRSVNVFLI